MKFRLLVFLTFLVIPTFIYAQKNTYIGYKYTGVNYNKSLPNGVKDLGGSLLEDDDYGVSRMRKGKTEMLWLAKITSRNSKGVPSWKVKDVLTLPSLKKNQDILQGFTFPCTVNKKEDLNLIVLGEFVPKTKNYKIIKAWRANTETNKFQVIATKGIACQSVKAESY